MGGASRCTLHLLLVTGIVRPTEDERTILELWLR